MAKGHRDKDAPFGKSTVAIRFSPFLMKEINERALKQQKSFTEIVRGLCVDSIMNERKEQHD